MDELIETKVKEAEQQIGFWSNQVRFAEESLAEWRGALQALRRLKADGEKKQEVAPVYTVDEVGA